MLVQLSKLAIDECGHEWDMLRQVKPAGLLGDGGTGAKVDREGIEEVLTFGEEALSWKGLLGWGWSDGCGDWGDCFCLGLFECGLDGLFLSL